MEEKIKVMFDGMPATDALKEYAMEKFSKHQYVNDHITSLDIVLAQRVAHRGKSHDFFIDVTADVPNNNIHVEESGADMYALIDTASDRFFRAIKRYHERLSHIKGERPWKVEYLDDASAVVGEEDTYVDYVPVVAERRKLEQLNPMEDAEAIEQMELSGREQFLFKSASSGLISMLYKRRRGGYAIVEVDESL